jgi:hypothetical protein
MTDPAAWQPLYHTVNGWTLAAWALGWALYRALTRGGAGR